MVTLKLIAPTVVVAFTTATSIVGKWISGTPGGSSSNSTFPSSDSSRDCSSSAGSGPDESAAAMAAKQKESTAGARRTMMNEMNGSLLTLSFAG